MTAQHRPDPEKTAGNQELPSTLPRWLVLDHLRGAALVAMIGYHAAWNAVNFGFTAWTVERDLALQVSARYIAGSFLLISGLAIALAATRSQRPLYAMPRYWRRLAMVAGAAALVSAATFIALPSAPIYFGILHHIAFTGLVLAALAHAHPFLAIALGALVLIGDSLLALPALNHPSIIWLGLGTAAPITADWVPVFPWLAAGLFGFGLGKAYIIPWLAGRAATQGATPMQPQARPDPLGWMGRHSLAIYLIHQPILVGLMMAYRSLSS